MFHTEEIPNQIHAVDRILQCKELIESNRAPDLTEYLVKVVRKKGENE